MGVPPAGTQPEQVLKRNFFSTPGGIALIVVLALLVISGVVLGTYFAMRRNQKAEEIKEMWQDFVDVTEEIDHDVDEVEDLSEIRSGSTIAEFRKNLEYDNIEELYIQVKTFRDIPEDLEAYHRDLYAAVDAYKEFLRKLDQFFEIFASDIMDSRLDDLLDDLVGLSEDVKQNADDFLKDNELVEETRFDPEILKLPESYIAQLLQMREEAQQKDQQDQSNKAVEEARAAVENLLDLYVQGNWGAVTQLMTPTFYETFYNRVPPPDQVSYIIDAAEVTTHRLVDNNTVVFTVLQTLNDGGEIFTEYIDLKMVRSGNTWLLDGVDYYD